MHGEYDIAFRKSSELLFEALNKPIDILDQIDAACTARDRTAMDLAIIRILGTSA